MTRARRARLDALTVIGNHEVALLQERRTATLDEVRRQLGPALDEWLAWIESWPTFVQGDGYILITRPGVELRALPSLQHRQQQPGRTSALRQRDRAGARA